jgi:hypothetical protein
MAALDDMDYFPRLVGLGMKSAEVEQANHVRMVDHMTKGIRTWGLNKHHVHIIHHVHLVPGNSESLLAHPISNSQGTLFVIR